MALSIADLEQAIRDKINSPRKQHLLLQNRASWNMLCSCLDAIGDTALAVASYRKGSNADRLDSGEKYVQVYGILQVLFVQQDALENLATSLDISYQLDPILKNIREVRNHSIGHPTKIGGSKVGKAYNFISRISLTRGGFNLMTTYADGSPTQHQNVSIGQLIDDQEAVVIRVLSGILATLEEEEVKHKEAFKDQHLTDVFPNMLSYLFSKVYEGANDSPSGNYFEYGKLCLEEIGKVIEEFKKRLQERDLLGALQGANHTLEEISYPLNELKKFFDQSTNNKLNSKDAYIFTAFLDGKVDLLIEIAQEIDRDYQSVNQDKPKEAGSAKQAEMTMGLPEEEEYSI